MTVYKLPLCCSRDTGRVRRGFTIVELLIVVVVIAILAAITIVAYNGITQQAKSSAAASAAAQLSKKITLFAATNNDTPPVNLSELGVASDVNVNYQYRTYNNGKNYCMTAAANGISYFVDSGAGSKVEKGACAGHGVDGAEAITNLALNPSFESSESNYAQMGGVGRDSSVTRVNTWSNSGSWSLEVKKTVTENVAKGIRVSVPVAFEVGDIVRWSAVVKNNASVSRSFHTYGERSTPTYAGLSGGAAVTIPAGGVAVIPGQITITTSNNGGAGAFGMGIIPDQVSPVGESYFVDSFIITKNQPLPSFADGNSPSWIWSGVPNNSVSIGPAL